MADFQPVTSCKAEPTAVRKMNVSNWRAGTRQSTQLCTSIVLVINGIHAEAYPNEGVDASQANVASIDRTGLS